MMKIEAAQTSATRRARALLCALFPPAKGMALKAVPGGVVMPGASFELLVDVRAAGLADWDQVVGRVHAETRDLLLVDPRVRNQDGPVTFAMHDGDAGVEKLVRLSFSLSASRGLSLVAPFHPEFAGFAISARTISLNDVAPWQDTVGHAVGIARASVAMIGAAHAIATDAVLH